MSYSNYQLNQKINNLQNQINNLDVNVDLQTVIDNGNSALGTIELSDTSNNGLFLNPDSVEITSTDGYSRFDYKKLLFSNNITNATLEYTDSTDTLDITTTNINLNGQVSFDTPPHSVTPILGDDLTTKGYVDSLVGQYSGGYNLYLNYSETLEVDTITYKYLSNQVSSATQQDLIITTDGTDQLLATFISDELNLTVIPAGLWSLVLYGAVSGAGGVLYYYFKLKKYSSGTITDIATSGNSPDVNATPTGNPDAYHMNATIDTPNYISLTDRIILEIYCIKVSGVNVQLNTYFESAYYSFIQTSLNAGTTLLTSDNNWKGNNNFAIIPTTITTTSGSNNTQITTTAYIYNELQNYLTTDQISSTYATIDSLVDYLTIGDAEITYATITSLNNYLTIANAELTYATQTALLTYLRVSEASATYLPITTASTTYAPKVSPSFSTGVTVSSGNLTITSGTITANGNITASGSSLIAPTIRNAANSASIGSTGTITGTSLVLGTGAIGCGTITLSGANGITTSGTTYTPTSAQVGYTLTGAGGIVSGIGTGGTTLVTTSNLPIGIYAITFTVSLDTFSAGTAMFVGYSFPVTGGCSATIGSYYTTGSVQAGGASFSGYLVCTTATNSIGVRPNTSTGTVQAVSSRYTVIKIA